MLLHWRNCVLGLFVVGLVCAVESQMEINYDNHEDSSERSEESIRLEEIQNRFVDIVSNHSHEMESLSEVMKILHTEAGREMRKLALEGFMLGYQQKNAGPLFGQFLWRVHEKLSPKFVDSLDDYRDFFKGMDISTMPLIWEQLFKKDELGNSLAGLPLGQLVDMLQPTASKYGIDIRAMMNSLMGKGDNNVRDLILNTLENTDLASLWGHFVNATTNTGQTSGQKNKNGEGAKKGKADKTLRLFRPFVASLLKDNEIDLDADAVLEVLSPLFKSDMIPQASSWINMLTRGDMGEGGGAVLASLIGNLLGGGQHGGFSQRQIAGVIGTLGGLISTGGKNQMDMNSIINMASMFISKPSKKKGNKDKSKKKTEDGLDLGSLMSMAGKLVGDNINMDSILEMATTAVKSEFEKRKGNEPASKASAKKSKTAKQETATAPKPPNKESPKAKQANPKSGKISKNLIDIIEPILLSMKTDKKCNSKIKDAIDLGKTLLKSKISSLGDLSQIIPLLVSSVAGGDTLAEDSPNIEKLMTSFTQVFAHADWNEFLESLENRDFREMLIQNIAPNAAEVVMLMATEKSQNKIYDAVVPRIQGFLASYGLVGVTLDNFPERLAPMLGLLGKGWNLPFNPTTILVPLKVYLKGLKSWALKGLQEVTTLTPKEVERRVIEALDEDVCEAVLRVLTVTRNTNEPHCLPQRLCQISEGGAEPDSLRAAVTRVASLVTASGPVLQTPDSNLLLQTIRAISGTEENCKVAFPGDCATNQGLEESEDDEDSITMDLLYEHQEL